MSTCWWSNNIIIAWTRKFIEFLFVKKKLQISSYRGHSIASQFPLDLKKKINNFKPKKRSVFKNEKRKAQESRKKNEFSLFTIEMYWRLDKKS